MYESMTYNDEQESKVLGDLSLITLNPNWHEAGHFSQPCNSGIGFCKLNLYQKFSIFFGGENLYQSNKLIESYKNYSKVALKMSICLFF